MKPIHRESRTAYQNGPTVSVADVNDTDITVSFDNLEDTYNEDGENSFLADNIEESTLNDEEIKIKALNQAVNIAKLMSGVTVDNVLEIAAKVAKFIKKVF